MKGRWRNVLVISSDEHDPRHAGFSGSPVVRTPHLDRLAAGLLAHDRQRAVAACQRARRTKLRHHAALIATYSHTSTLAAAEPNRARRPVRRAVGNSKP